MGGPLSDPLSQAQSIVIPSEDHQVFVDRADQLEDISQGDYRPEPSLLCSLEATTGMLRFTQAEPNPNKIEGCLSSLGAF